MAKDASRTRIAEETGLFVKQFNYDAELQKLIGYGWKSAAPARPAAPAPTPIARTLTIGRGRKGKEVPHTLRTGFKRPAGMLNAWDHMKEFEQVGAYAFCGDRRPPEQIRTSKGFQPPAERELNDPSYISVIASHFVEYLKSRGDRVNTIPTGNPRQPIRGK